jgi:TRAP-type C4-dicarboxylate transport system permease small subunit
MKLLLEKLAWSIKRISEITLFAMMALTMADVCGRYVLNIPVTGSVELTELLMVAVIFSGIALSTIYRGHVTVDLIAMALSGRMRWLQKKVGDAVSLLIVGVLAFVCWGKAAEVADYGDKTAVLFIPIAPAAYFMAVMLTLTGIYHFIQLFESVEEGVHNV